MTAIESRTLSSTDIEQLARRLYDDERAARAGAPLSEAHPEMTVADAYAVQLGYVSARQAAGARIAGHKVGCTNPVIQKLFSIDQPDYGHLLDDMILPDGAAISMRTLVSPRVEPEIAFVLREPLRGPGVTPVHVLLATAGVLPCFEIIDSRIEDWRIKFVDTVADNGSSARCVLGDRLVPVEQLDLRVLGVVLECNGEVAATGAGAAALGHPATAVAWLANTLAERGQFLDAGHIVLPGALTTAPNAHAGDVFVGSFAGLGTVRCRFVD
jgi:2-keto-4-pentenoate hydratase